MFSGLRKKVKKFIPKEVRPFVPYLAAMIPGAGLGLGAFAQSNPAMYKALMAGGTKFLSDDEASLKDVAITSALSAAPQMLGDFAGPTGPDPDTFKGMLQGGARTLAEKGPLTTLAAQTGIDTGIKQAEIAKEELDEYNRMLKEQGIGDRKARRGAIYDIFMNAGYDADYVNEMLDGYGYADGGRIGLYGGGSSNVEPDFISMREVVENVNEDQMKEGIMQMAYEPGVPTTGDLYDMKNPDYKGINPSIVKEFIEEGIPLGYNSPEEYYEDFYGIMGMEKGGRAGYRYGKSVQRTKRKQKAPPSAGITAINIKAETSDDEEAMTMADFIEAMKGDDGFDPENLTTMKEGLEMFYGTPMSGNAKPVPMMRFKKGGKVKSKGGGMDASSSDFEEYITIMGEDGPIRIKKSDYEAMPGMFVDTTTSLYGDSSKGRPVPDFKAKGGLMGLKMGGRPMEMDYRQGGFIPVGSKERADDVPARLSKNEFVMTADAVRAAGGGSVNKGAKRMYNLMNNLEAKV